MHVATALGRWGRFVALAALVAATLVSLPGGAGAAPPERSAAEYWTPERRADAVPRDLVVDERGQGYLRRPDGTLEPYGGGGAQPSAKPSSPGKGGGGGSDTTAPGVAGMDPAKGTTITTSSYAFAATVSDDSGVKSVTFHVTDPNGSRTSHTAALLSGSTTNGTWGATVSLPTNGDWSWTVEARDTAKKGGNVTTEGPVGFVVHVDASGGGDTGDPEPVVTNAAWTGGGTVQTAAGRIYFEMPTNGVRWGGYVCSGTVATDAATARSIIITAAHCIYDEAKDVFARNVLFIPDQAGTSAGGTNTNCDDDPMGCWEPTHGVVHSTWANGSWPSIIPSDYGYYVVPDSGAHKGAAATSDSLADAAGSLTVQFSPTEQGVYTHALGYSYSEDPKFMYCAEDLGTDANYGTLWLGACELSGGASGGPWMQPVKGGNGPIVAVNSYGYSTRSGMGAAHLTGTARCLFDVAQTADTPSSTVRGIVSSCSS